MILRRALVALFVCIGVGTGVGAASASTDPGGSSPSTTVPVGCPPPPASQAVFVGRLDTLDATSGTYTVERLRSGSLAGYSTETTATNGDLVTTVVVYYGRDVKFLAEGDTYLVGTALDPNTGRLFSRVSENTPLFGGNQVADINNSGVVCPTFDDPARTLYPDGSGIESGVLSSLDGNGSRVVLAIIVPAGLVLLGLVTLVLIRRLLVAAKVSR